MAANSLYLTAQSMFYNTDPNFLLQNYIATDPTKVQLDGTFASDTLSATNTAAYQITGDLSTLANYTDDNTPFDGRNGLVFQTGSDTITGGSHNDILTGDFYSFYFTVGGNPVQGNNALIAGNDTISGGNGNDLIIGDIGREGSWIQANPDFSTGIVEHYGNDTLSGGNGDDVIYGDEGVRSSVGAFQYHYLYFGNDKIDGGNGNDVLVGDNGAIILRTIAGSGDAAHLLFHGGDDVINGGNGDDILIGDFDLISLNRISGTSAVKDNVFQMGNDILNGGDGNDILIGDYNTFSNPLNFQNTIIGGNDILTGGKGSDTFVFNFMHNGNDVVTDFNPNEDKVVIKGAGDHQSISLSVQGKDVFINLNDGVDLNHDSSILLQNVSVKDLLSHGSVGADLHHFTEQMAAHGWLVIV